MTLKTSSIFLKAPFLYTDHIEGGDLLYNPDGNGGVSVVGSQLLKAIELCDGKKTVTQLAKYVKCNPQELLKLFETLCHKQFLFNQETPISFPISWSKTLTSWFHITNACNLNCSYCYIHKDNGSMTLDTAKQGIDKIINSCVKHNYTEVALMLSGGEPLIEFQKIRDIINYTQNQTKLLELRSKFIILSNGTLINQDIAMYVKNNNISIGISLDGLEDQNDKNRYYNTGKGSFNNVISGINTLINVGIKPSIMVTVSRENFRGLPELTRKLINMKTHFRFSLERNIETGIPSILSVQDELIETFKKCFDIMKRAIKKGNHFFTFKFGDVSWNHPSRRSCSAGKGFFAFRHDGQISMCGLDLDSPLTNIKNVEDIITEIPLLCSDISLHSCCEVEACSTCVWRHSCAGACPIQTKATYGSINNVSPYCSIYKDCLPEVLKIHAMQIMSINKLSTKKK